MSVLEIHKILWQTKERNDFDGIPITANYDKKFWPFNWVDSNGNVKGVFHEALKIACSALNLSLSLQKPLDENNGIWYQK